MRAKRHASCSIAKPVLGGCAFRGAKMALQPITDALHLIHGPIVCQGHNWDSRPTSSSGSTLHRLAVSTDIDDLDIVFGGDVKLAKALDALVERYDPPAVFVYQTCLPGMTGDDIEATCRAAALRLARPIVAVDAPGFSGGKLAGARKAGDILLEKVIGSREPDFATAADVVLIGDYNVAGEAEHIAALIASAGMRVVASVPGGGRFADIAGAHRARLSITHCSQALGDLAERLRARHGVPFVEASFYGAEQTSAALRAAAAKLVELGALPRLVDDCESFVAEAEAHLASQLAALTPWLSGKRALLLTGGVKTWSLARALRHFGMEIVGVTANKTSESDRRRLREVLGNTGIAFDALSMTDLRGLLAEGQIDVVLGGGGARFEVAAAGIPWIEINHERRMSLTGYDGALNLAIVLASALKRPAWREMRAAAPW